MMSPTPSRLALFALLLPLLNGDVSTTMALQPSSSSSSSEPRRSFLARGVSIAGAAFLATATADHVAGCTCGGCSSSSQHRFFHPEAADAFERRDVGGADASPATKAMNEQAYQTQARLERDGVRLEVRVLPPTGVLLATLMPTTVLCTTNHRKS